MLKLFVDKIFVEFEINRFIELLGTVDVVECRDLKVMLDDIHLSCWYDVTFDRLPLEPLSLVPVLPVLRPSLVRHGRSSLECRMCGDRQDSDHIIS